MAKEQNQVSRKGRKLTLTLARQVASAQLLKLISVGKLPPAHWESLREYPVVWDRWYEGCSGGISYRAGETQVDFSLIDFHGKSLLVGMKLDGTQYRNDRENPRWRVRRVLIIDRDTGEAVLDEEVSGSDQVELLFGQPRLDFLVHK